MRTAKIEVRDFLYDPLLLKSWRDGFLPREWQRKYSHIFDKDDLRIALSQPAYHFGEWIAAIAYAGKGYRVLVEKYLYKNHGRKIKIISQFFNPAQISFLKYPSPRHQPPDLFVYKGKRFFFVEVKRDGDRLKKSQARCFRGIEKELVCEVKVLHIKAQKS